MQRNWFLGDLLNQFLERTEIGVAKMTNGPLPNYAKRYCLPKVKFQASLSRLRSYGATTP
ncbi:hypothetical protein I5192_13170 [Ruegeria sp. SCSIO 43209]|uniref:hypothetical protein n=1 Tax=Ruegeria sp. SCSIO 43209 TaxID=2793010 RepID=UPI001CA8DBDC|nr:hypothetical protein [Ruegeria sp. SCSIO 43209]UAB88173.1 hypothetical protein I5192_13170 [Ruegeria sp. SCSIO 43209]